VPEIFRGQRVVFLRARSGGRPPAVRGSWGDVVGNGQVARQSRRPRGERRRRVGRLTEPEAVGAEVTSRRVGSDDALDTRQGGRRPGSLEDRRGCGSVGAPSTATGELREVRLSTRRGRRSYAPATGRTPVRAAVLDRGRAGRGRRRGRRPTVGTVRRAAWASPAGSAREGSGSRRAVRPPAPQAGRRLKLGSVPRLGAGRWPSTTSQSGHGCAVRSAHRTIRRSSPRCAVRARPPWRRPDPHRRAWSMSRGRVDAVAARAPAGEPGTRGFRWFP
jgi:hypothetical protein